MTDEREPDPAEKYFEILESLMPDTAENRVFIAQARANYRLNSRYTDEYWNQREAYLKQMAQERAQNTEQEKRSWIKRLKGWWRK